MCSSDLRAALAATGAVSGDELTTARNGLDTAQATLDQARQQLAAQKAMVASGNTESNPEIQAARVALDRAQLDLDRTVIRAPINGIVAQNTAQIGQRVQAGASLMTVAPVGEAYVNANFKESQLAYIHPGQDVTLTSDLYGSDVVFHGHVVGLGGGAGSAFATIPAQNATGNWIKVVQRLPVRIELDPKELAQHPLRVGLSMQATIDVHDQSGKDISSSATPPAQKTDVYARDAQAADALVAQIIQQNQDDTAPAAAAQ